MKTIIFYDWEATSLHPRYTRALEVGCFAVTYNDNGNEVSQNAFYGQIQDVSLKACDDWIKANIIAHLKKEPTKNPPKGWTEIFGTFEEVQVKFKEWFYGFKGSKEVWAYCDLLDKQMMVEILAEKWRDFNELGEPTGTPEYLDGFRGNKFYDINTMIKVLAPQENLRTLTKEFLNDKVPDCISPIAKSYRRHNPVWDAYKVYLAYTKLKKKIPC